MEGQFNNSNVEIVISWENHNTVIISGCIVKENMYKLKKVKENLPDKCDYEIIYKNLYLNLK